MWMNFSFIYFVLCMYLCNDFYHQVTVLFSLQSIGDTDIVIWRCPAEEESEKREKTQRRLTRISDEGAADWHTHCEVYSTWVLEEHTHRWTHTVNPQAHTQRDCMLSVS